MNQQALSERFRDVRSTRDLSLRAVAAEIGVSASTLSRFEQLNMPMDLDNLGRISEWLGEPLSDGAVSVVVPNTLDAICSVIRNDKTLTTDGAESLVRIFSAAYEAWAGKR